jgi:hypothetical protein
MRGRFVLALAFAAPVASAAADERKVDYSATPSNPEVVQYITHAVSPKGGSCCEWADGYQLGKQYLLVDLSNEEKTFQVMLLKWEMNADGFYHATVWDDRARKYVELIADYAAFAAGNPTSTPIVWLWRPDGKNLEIRCWGGEFQG